VFESGDWCAEDEFGNPVYNDFGEPKCGEGMIMPDGTKLNRGKGFDYQETTLGFYFDADVLVGDKSGYNSGLHTNDDDFMFVTVKVRNESGDWCAEDEYGVPIVDSDGNQICGDGMIMPDGTKLNRGKGFDYQETTLGFYFDADVLVGDKSGYNSGLHTNDDDFMKY
jgi:hypothetical protein